MRFLYTIMGATCLATIGAMAAGDLGSEAKQTKAAAYMGAPAVVETAITTTTIDELMTAAELPEVVAPVNRINGARAFTPGLEADEREVAISRWHERLDVARAETQRRNIAARNAPKSRNNVRRSSPRRVRTYSQRPRARYAKAKYARTNVLQRSSWRKKVKNYIGGGTGYSRSDYNTGRYRRAKRIGASRNYR